MKTNSTVVSIFHEKDIDFINLQARSFDLFVPDRFFDKIIIIDNCLKPIGKDNFQKLKRAYGRHSSIVDYFLAKDICSLKNMEGWFSQQALKLAISLEVLTSQYIVLDAKDHFVFPISKSFIYADNGMPYLSCHSYIGHPLQDFLTRSLSLFDLNEDKYVQCFYQTITPYVMYTNVVRHLICTLEQKRNKPFFEVLRGELITEFFAYAAFIVSTYDSIQKYYCIVEDKPDNISKNIWPEFNDAKNISIVLKGIEDSKYPLFSLHRRAVSGLSSSARDVVSSFWTRRGLFHSNRQANLFLRRQRLKLMIESMQMLYTRLCRRIKRNLI